MLLNGLYDFTPSLSITTISPFTISLSNLAPIISNAQVSEEIILAFQVILKLKVLFPGGP